MSTDLTDLNNRWFQAWLEKDAGTVDQLMSEDYVYIAPSGMLLDRQAILGIIRAPSYQLDQFAHTEVLVRALGDDAAIVRDRRQSSGSFAGATYSDDFRGVMVWEKTAGKWQLVLEQCSFNTA